MLKALSPLGPRLPEDAINPKPSHLPWNLFIWPLRKHGTLNPKHHFGANRGREPNSHFKIQPASQPENPIKNRWPKPIRIPVISWTEIDF